MVETSFSSTNPSAKIPWCRVLDQDTSKSHATALKFEADQLSCRRMVVNGGGVTIFFDANVRSYAIAPIILKPSFTGDPGRFRHIVDIERLASFTGSIAPLIQGGNDRGDDEIEDEIKDEIEDEIDDDEGNDALSTEELDLDEAAPDPAGSSHPTEKITRPPNSWIIFRKQKAKELRDSNPNMSRGEVSTEASRQWKAMSDETKGFYQAMAKEAALQHKIKYPEYHNKPGRK